MQRGDPDEGPQGQQSGAAGSPAGGPAGGPKAAREPAKPPDPETSRPRAEIGGKGQRGDPDEGPQGQQSGAAGSPAGSKKDPELPTTVFGPNLCSLLFNALKVKKNLF